MGLALLPVLLVLLASLNCCTADCGSSFLTFNAFLVPGFDYEPRLNQLLRTLSAEEADVICLQEVWLEKDIRKVCIYLLYVLLD